MRRLWAESLIDFDPNIIIAATKKVIDTSEYLPTLNKMREACRRELFASIGLPEIRDAYIEACNAPSPKAGFNWSHSVIYQAGKDAGWHLLASEVESKAFPIFAKYYNVWCDKVISGDFIPDPKTPELPEKPSQKLSKEEQLQRMAELRKALDI